MIIQKNGVKKSLLIKDIFLLFQSIMVVIQQQLKTPLTIFTKNGMENQRLSSVMAFMEGKDQLLSSSKF